MATRSKSIQSQRKISGRSSWSPQEKNHEDILYGGLSHYLHAWKSSGRDDPFNQRTYKQVLDIAKRYKKHLESKGIPIKKMYLFGSYAKHRAHYASDIDLCIIIPKIKDRWKWQVKCAMETRDMPGIIQPHIYASSHFTPKNELPCEIMETGIEIQ